MTAVRLHHEVAGPADAPVLLLGGSLGSTTAMWDPQLPELTRTHRVIRYDHRGHGGSPVPEGPYELADLGGDVLALLDRLGVARASYCGLSLGGMVGMWLAVQAPERIDRLVLCCTSARLGPPQMWSERAAAVRAGGTASIAEFVVGRWFTPGWRAEHPEATGATVAMVGGIPAAGYAGCCHAIQTMDQRGDLPAITAPTLVIGGSEDPSTPNEHQREIAAGIPGARLEIVGPAAHLATIERAAECTALIADHLAGARA